MSEKPIIMSGPMVRAYLDGRKTQTRRIMKPQPEHRENESLPGHFGTWFHHWNLDSDFTVISDIIEYCPYGGQGDSIWWRESFAIAPSGKIYYAATSDRKGWKPSIHMPRTACRIVTPLTRVRYERLQDISRGDCMSEGCPFPNMAKGPDPRKWFADLWDSLNLKRGFGWNTNPWVWVLEFDQYD